MLIGKKEFDESSTAVMAIVNLTPDSFYDGGKFYKDGKVDIDKVLYEIERFEKDGADIIDIGAESTRRGFSKVPEDEEIERLIPTLRKVKDNFKIPISIDTYKAGVAKAVIQEGADLINDIGFCSGDMVNVLADSNVCYCLNHNRVVTSLERDKSSISMEELNNEIRDKLVFLKEHGVNEDRVIIDPGLGFGKSNADDIMILNNINKLKIHGRPILIGASNKSCVEYVIHTDKDDRLEGTLAVTAKAYLSGASFVRVHDVRSNVRFIQMFAALNV